MKPETKSEINITNIENAILEQSQKQVEINGEYLDEIVGLFKTLNVFPVKYLGEGTINHGWIVNSKNTEERKVLVIGPKIPKSDFKSSVESGYLDDNKFVKAMEITGSLAKIDVPAIQFISAGKIVKNDFTFAWGLEELADGTPLSGIWESLTKRDRNALIVDIGKVMGQYEVIKHLNSVNSPEDAKKWYLNRIHDLTNDGVDMGVFNKNKANQIILDFKKILNEVDIQPKIGLIHGDMFQPNIFVNKDDNGYHISNIIDWETATVGHVGYEQILSAWWLSGEQGGDRKIFEQIIHTSANNGIGMGFMDKDLTKAVTIVDLLWHVNVIVSCSTMQKYSDVPRWTKNLDSILNLIENNEPYAKFSNN